MGKIEIPEGKGFVPNPTGIIFPARGCRLCGQNWNSRDRTHAPWEAHAKLKIYFPFNKNEIFGTGDRNGIEFTEGIVINYPDSIMPTDHQVLYSATRFSKGLLNPRRGGSVSHQTISLEDIDEIWEISPGDYSHFREVYLECDPQTRRGELLTRGILNKPQEITFPLEEFYHKLD